MGEKSISNTKAGEAMLVCPINQNAD
jgi:hypothetical protein